MTESPFIKEKNRVIRDVFLFFPLLSKKGKIKKNNKKIN